MVTLDKAQASSPSPSTAAATYFKVYLRLRPLSTQSSISPSRFLHLPTTSPLFDPSEPQIPRSIHVTPPASTSKSRPLEKFTFQRVFDESTGQLEIFRETVLPLVQDVMLGKDAMLATLGTTGSGKSHTVLGSGKEKGMVQMALETVFRSVEGRMVEISGGGGVGRGVDLRKGDRSDAWVMECEELRRRLGCALEVQSSRRPSMIGSSPRVPDLGDLAVEVDTRSSYAILVSMYELYNDKIYDLLDETPIISPSTRRKALVFKKPSSASSWDNSSTKAARKVVSGLRKIYCSTLSEALTVLEYGQTNRRVNSTSSNSTSSRSHAFFTIEIRRFSARHIDQERDVSTLQIVDLAGSERARNAQTAGDRLVEAGSINRSLMTLGQCLQMQTTMMNNTSATAITATGTTQSTLPTGVHTSSSSNNNAATSIVRSSKLTELLFANAFTRPTPGSSSSQPSATMIVTADPRGDYNATSQILRYSALATEVTVPRRAATTTAASSRSASSSSIQSTGSFTDHPLHHSQSDSSAILDDDASKDEIIARLISQLEETESQWLAAEDRCLSIEQSVREEMAAEMESRVSAVLKEAHDMRKREEEMREGYLDHKLDILMRGLDITSTSPFPTPSRAASTSAIYEDPHERSDSHHLRQRLRELEDENDHLRIELMKTKRELNNRSPSVGQAGAIGSGRKVSVQKKRIVSGNGAARALMEGKGVEKVERPLGPIENRLQGVRRDVVGEDVFEVREGTGRGLRA